MRFSQNPFVTMLSQRENVELNWNVSHNNHCTRRHLLQDIIWKLIPWLLLLQMIDHSSLDYRSVIGGL